MHYLLFYELAADYPERRGALRPAHFAHAQAAVRRGELILGGALTEPMDRAALLFQCDSLELVAEFAKMDPYVTQGLVVAWEVRQWQTVVGPTASLPNVVAELGIT